jgi:hypothetical protein
MLRLQPVSVDRQAMMSSNPSPASADHAATGQLARARDFSEMLRRRVAVASQVGQDLCYHPA